MAEFQRALFDDVRETFRALKTQDDSARLRIEDLPTALRDRFIGVTGKYLLMVNPKKDVWKRENQRELIEQLERVDPNATGTPVQLYHYTDLLKQQLRGGGLVFVRRHHHPGLPPLPQPDPGRALPGAGGGRLSVAGRHDGAG